MKYRTSSAVVVPLLAVGLGFLAVACGSGGGDGDKGGSGGAAGGQAGSEQSGGKSAGGEDGTGTDANGGQAGGAQPSGGSGGAMSATGGASGTGGVMATGGAAQTGGTANTGTGTGGTGGTGGTAAASTCATLLCSDFEDGTVTMPFRSTTSLAKVEPLPPEMARKGSTKAFHLRVAKGGTGALIRARNFKHMGSLHGRMYYYMSRSHDKLGHTYLFRAGGSPNVEFGGQFGGWLLAPAGEINRFKKPFPAQKWACVQWEANQTTKSISVTVDGVSIGKATAKAAFTSFETVDVGYFTYHPEDYDQPLDVWIDDVVLDDKPVPCL